MKLKCIVPFCANARNVTSEEEEFICDAHYKNIPWRMRHRYEQAHKAYKVVCVEDRYGNKLKIYEEVRNTFDLCVRAACAAAL